LLKRLSFTSLYCFGTLKNQANIEMWVYFWTLYLLELFVFSMAYILCLIPRLHFLDVSAQSEDEDGLVGTRSCPTSCLILGSRLFPLSPIKSPKQLVHLFSAISSVRTLP
jgi:hypothetical protein